MVTALPILPFAATLSLWWSLPPSISLSLDLFTNYISPVIQLIQMFLRNNLIQYLGHYSPL